VVLTRDQHIAGLTTVTIAPITSTMRGVPSEVLLDEEDGLKGPCAVNLHGAITVPQNLLGPWVAQLGPEKMKEICAALRFALGCESW
jgi:mRNA interferase MazF